MKRRWLDDHWRDLLIVVAGFAVVLRVLLIVRAPVYGYVWDFYQEGVARLYEHGRLPLSTDCWQCYHPPLFYWLGWPFYAVGARLSAADDGLAWRMLAGESLYLARALDWSEVRFRKLVRWMKRWWKRAPMVGKLAVILVAACGVAGAGYLAYRIFFGK